MAPKPPSTENVDYVVYMPIDGRATCQPIHVPRRAQVKHLVKAIREDDEFKVAIRTEMVYLYKCGVLPMEPECDDAGEQRYNQTKDWLSRNPKPKQMNAARLLETYFPNGPTKYDEKKIDVIAVTGSILDNLCRPSTPDNQTTPCQTSSETQKLVDAFLKTFEARLESYLNRPSWNDFWSAPSSADDEIARYINELQIPRIAGNPVLLLHDLGGDVVDPGIVDGLFNDTSRFLVNTSGSGKTRLLLEGLSKHWGFYYTTSVNSSNHWLGSVDIMDAINEQIPNSRSFTNKPADLKESLLESAYKINHYIARRRFFQVLRARTLIFEHYLKTVRDTHPDRSINDFKKHWLFLQLQPIKFVGKDIFRHMSELLTDANDEYMMMVRTHEIHKNLDRMQNDFGLGNEFYLVLDEAQKAIYDLDGCFCSANGVFPRPVLRPLVTAWTEAMYFPIIVSGTSLSIDVVNEVMNSAVGKIMPFEHATRTSAFDNEKRQHEYILRYMPDHLTKTESGKEFLHRAWTFARGRHRFTAALLTQLLKFSFRAPHRILNAFVGAFCRYVPSDAQRFVEGEKVTESIKEGLESIIGFDISKLGVNRINLLSEVLYTWLILRRQMPLSDKDKDLVELGFARFVDSPKAEVKVDEPLVLLAVTHHLSNIGFSLNNHVLKGLEQKMDVGEHFEVFVANCLMCAFDNERELCDIFDFGEIVPSWTKQPAELVSVVFKDKRTEASRFHLPNFLGCTIIGFKSEAVNTTTTWLKNPTSLLCFPDGLMGPDIILFIRLPCGFILAVVVQCKWLSKLNMDKTTLESAITSLDLSQIYKHQSLTVANQDAARKCTLDMFRRLNGPDFEMRGEGWFQTRLPVLKVIASFPTVASKVPAASHIATLNMDDCSKLVDEHRFLDAAKESLGIKRDAEGDVPCTPCKRPREGSPLSGGKKNLARNSDGDGEERDCGLNDWRTTPPTN